MPLRTRAKHSHTLGTLVARALLQVVMVCSWFFMPPNANIIVGAKFTPAGDAADSGSGVWEPSRHFLDGKVALLLYLATAMAWYGVQTGLFQAGDSAERCAAGVGCEGEGAREGGRAPLAPCCLNPP